MNKEFNNVISAFKNLSTEEKKEALYLFPVWVITMQE